MWIFGYGSLVWKADFPYVKKVIGYIKGYERKFWQASIDHRGVPGKPGRVVTLIPSEDPEAKVWGAAYKIHSKDIENVVKHLDMREVMGYEKTPVDFYPTANHPMNLFDVETSSSTSVIESLSGSSVNNGQNRQSENHDSSISNNGITKNGESLNGSLAGPLQVHHSHSNGAVLSEKQLDEVIQNGLNSHYHKNGYNMIIANKGSNSYMSDDSDEDEKINAILEGTTPGHFHVTMYYGNSENAHFVGPAPLDEMAHQIFTASGPSGTNKEYLFNLADAMRQICEDAIDSHLAELEMRVRKLEISSKKRKSGRSTPIEL